MADGQPAKKAAAKKAAATKAAATKAAATKAAATKAAATGAKKTAATKRAAPKRPAKKASPLTNAQRLVVRWASSHGAPVALLDGWNPADGTWAEKSPIGTILGYLRDGTYLHVAARNVGIHSIERLVASGAEHADGQPEDREYIPIEILPFVDLHRQIAHAESGIEVELTTVIVDRARKDPSLAMQFLGRRFPARWREQQQVLTVNDIDERDVAITRAIEDPNVAMHLAAVAEHIEREAQRETVDE